MNKLVRTTLALVALGACAAASAAPFDAADRERRERNREELMARYGEPGSATTDRTMDRRSAYDRDDDRGSRSSMREKTHHAAEKTRSFTHRQAEKLRNFGERQDSKYGKKSSPRQDPYKHAP
jgi:hypothetical protein